MAHRGIDSSPSSGARSESAAPAFAPTPAAGPRPTAGAASAPTATRERPPAPATSQADRNATDQIEGDLALNRPGAAVSAEARRRTTGWTRLGRLLGLRTRDASWRVGAAGERRVGRTLRIARLFGWRTLHAVPRGRGDIDHVLIGPGVITINTKHHPGAVVKAGRQVVFVNRGRNGRETDYASKARSEARFAADKLTAAVGATERIEVTPALVLVGTVRVRGRRTAGVSVLPRRWLVPYLIARSVIGRPRLSREERDALYEAARRPSTWR